MKQCTTRASVLIAACIKRLDRRAQNQLALYVRMTAHTRASIGAYPVQTARDNFAHLSRIAYMLRAGLQYVNTVDAAIIADCDTEKIHNNFFSLTDRIDQSNVNLILLLRMMRETFTRSVL